MAEDIIYLLAATGFAAAPFRRSSSCDTWAHWTFYTVAVAFIILGVCGLLVNLGRWDLSPHELSMFRSASQAVRGFIIGCSFVLFVSGNLFGKKNLKEEEL
jgi:hypothetical protein